jgi:sugar-specific transcriptional regulator TrmB
MRFVSSASQKNEQEDLPMAVLKPDEVRTRFVDALREYADRIEKALDTWEAGLKNGQTQLGGIFFRDVMPTEAINGRLRMFVREVENKVDDVLHGVYRPRHEEEINFKLVSKERRKGKRGT